MLSHEEFWKLHDSPAARAKRQEAKPYFKYRCAVCGYDYRKKGKRLEAHHLRYYWNGKCILGKEVIWRDFRCLCEEHHSKGKLTLHQIQMWRSSYRWRKRTKWCLGLILAAIRAVLRRLRAAAVSAVGMFAALLRVVLKVAASFFQEK